MKPAGERPPYTALLIGLAMLAAYLVNMNTPAISAAEILRDGPSPAAPWTRPTIEALLEGRACIPVAVLLENRELGPVHSYRRDVACERSLR